MTKGTKPEILSCIAGERRRKGIGNMMIYSNGKPGSLTFLDKETQLLYNKIC